MDDEALTRACRPGVDADQALAAAVQRGATEYADTGPVEADHIARIYRRRVEHLALEGLLRSDRSRVLSDLASLQMADDPVSVVIRTEGDDPKTVYTAFLVDSNMRACFWHELPEGFAPPLDEQFAP